MKNNDKFFVRLDEDVHTYLDKHANAEKIEFSKLVNDLLRRAITSIENKLKPYNPPIPAEERVSSQESSKLLLKITDDFQALSSLDPNTHLQFHRRTITRALFASIDAYCFCLHCEILDAHESGKIQLSKKDEKLLLSQRFPKLKEYLKVCTRGYAVYRGVEVPENVSNFPSEFYSVIRLRDRITHPKSITEYDISDREFNSLRKIGSWYIDISNWYRDLKLQGINNLRKELGDNSQSLRDMIKMDIGRDSKK